MGRSNGDRYPCELGVEVTYTTDFDPGAPSEEVWKRFSAEGRLSNFDPKVASSVQQMAAAIAVRFTLAPGEKKLIPMALSWDFPIVQYGGGRKWVRHYTQFFNASGKNAWGIARIALENGKDWSRQIDAWQKPYLADDSDPAWYRAELFNELYYLADGGTIWGHELNGPSNPYHPASEKSDSFSSLECFDYPFYGTLDVRFYGSWPLIKFWPELEKQEMRQYSDTIPEENDQRAQWRWKMEHDICLKLSSAKLPARRRTILEIRKRLPRQRQSIRLARRNELARPQQQICTAGMARLRFQGQ